MRVQLEPRPGQELSECISKAIAIAKASEGNVDFRFNGVTLDVYPNSCQLDINEKYDLKIQIEQLKEKLEEATS